MRASWVGFSWKLARSPGSPSSTPALRKCSPMEVLPAPEGPATSVVVPRSHPVATISSRWAMPLRSRSSLGL